MGKAREIRDYFEAHPLAPEAMERRYPGLPALKLKPEAVVDLVEGSEVTEALNELATKRARNVLVRDDASGLEGVLIPLDRYVELVGRELQGQPFTTMRPDRKFEPEGLRQSDVELVDPHAEWPHLRRG